MVYIIGGTINPRLKKWLKELRVQDYYHITLNTYDITPSALKKMSETLLNEIVGAHAIISVGRLADKLLSSTFTSHGVLPYTTEKNKKVIDKHIKECINYLYNRSSYGIVPPNTVS